MVSQQAFTQGNQVRLRTDPGRAGVITGKVREQAGTKKYQVVFPDGKSYQPEYELELLPEEKGDAWDLLEEKRFGRLSDLRRNISQIQLSGRLANIVYSMETTNTDFLAYQFKPVLSFLESPSKGILIADEVGLGKTVEAGLIWTELRSRYDARRLVVLCPAMLREKWRDELQKRFAVDAEICNAEELHEVLRKPKHEIPDGKGYVCSLQGLRPPRRFREQNQGPVSASKRLAQFLDAMADDEPLVDLLIVDEAHYLRNPESQTAKLGALLRDVSEHVVLLSATPINLRSEDLFHLLHLVDPDSFDVKEVFPQVLRANEPLMQARELALNKKAGGDEIKQKLNDAANHPLLCENRQLKQLVSMELDDARLEDRSQRIELANRIERINLLGHAVSRTRKVDVTEWRTVREPHSEFVDLPPEGPERKLYDAVTAAVRDYASDADISEGFLLALPQRQLSSSMYAAARSWLNSGRSDYSELSYEDLGQSVEDKGPDVSPLIERVRDKGLENIRLDELRKQDSKYNRFRDLVARYLAEHPEEKIIVFSYFRGTLVYLHERLSEEGIGSQLLMGGMRESKSEVIDRFRDDPSKSILLSSEVASEGVDLQFSRVLVNYDLPWNPMKVEQRIGRIDRIGQRAEKISIWNLCYSDTIDQRIYDRLYVRLGVFQRALGGMEAVLGEKIAELTGDLLRNNLTAEQETERIEKTALAIEQIRHDEDELERRASHLIAHSGYIIEQVQAAHDFSKRITESDLFAFVKDYLSQYADGHELKEINSGESRYRLGLPPKLRADLDDFIQKKKLYGQTRLVSDLTVECQFINKVRRPNQTTECISQFHPLVRFISSDLRRRDEGFCPLIAVELSARSAEGIKEGVYAFSVKRWTFEGLRVEEELRARAQHLGGGALLDAEEAMRMVDCARIEGRDWLAAKNELAVEALEEALGVCDELIDEEFRRVREQRQDANRDRVSFQVVSARKHRDRLVQSREGVLEEHRQRGRKALIAAEEGRIRKIEERFEMQSQKLENRSNMTSHSRDVCMGVIRVR